MTKLSVVWRDYADYTALASEQARKLGFAIAGVCWFFKAPSGFSLPTSVFWALVWVLTFFIFDLLQYVFGAAMIGLWARSHERRLFSGKKGIDGEVDKPVWLDRPALILYVLKLVLFQVNG